MGRDTLNAGIERQAGRGSYRLAVFVGAAALAIAGYYTYRKVASIGDQVIQLVVPGRHDLNLDAGSYTVFHEGGVVIDGRRYEAGKISNLNIAIVPLSSRDPVTVTSASGTSRYNLSGRTGYSVLNFDIREPGAYRLAAAYRDGHQEPRVVLALGKGFVGTLLTTVLGGALIALGGVGLAVALAARTARLRRQA